MLACYDNGQEWVCDCIACNEVKEHPLLMDSIWRSIRKTPPKPRAKSSPAQIVNRQPVTALRPPSTMARIGEFYWPDGIPVTSSNPFVDVGYVDKDGIAFHVCYTQNQIDAQIRKWGFVSPYTPFMILARLSQKFHFFGRLHLVRAEARRR